MTKARCTVGDCEDDGDRKGMCQKHYRKFMKYGDPLASRPVGRPRLEASTDHRKLDPLAKAQREVERIARRDAARAAKTHCAHGHALTPENTYTTKKGQTVCRICQRVANQKRHGRHVDDQTPIGTWNRDKTHCAWGHEYTPENTYIKTDGSRGCKVCTKASRIKSTYGLTREETQGMLTNQDNACAICHASFTTTSVCVDHFHESGAVRGLLCGECNLGLGKFKDQPALLLTAAQYLLDSEHFQPSTWSIPGSGH